MDSGPDDQPPKKNGKDHGRVVSFPTSQERERLRQEREEIEKAKKANEEAWRKSYQKQTAGEKVPFFGERARNIPPFTKYTVLGFIAIYLVTLFLPIEQYEWLLMNLAFVPGRYSGALEWNLFALIAPVTSLYLHFGLMHLGMNSFMMLVMGIFLETSFGARRAFLFFLLCGLSGNLLFFLLNPGQVTPLLGASGAIDGFFAVFLIINWSRMPLPPHLHKRGYAPLMVFWILLTVALGFVFPGTAWEAHLGGLLAGWGVLELWKRGKIRV